MTTPAEHVLALLEQDPPDPASLAWLRAGLRRYVTGNASLPEALGIVEACPRGLRDAVRHASVGRNIQAAARLLGPNSTTHAKARLISGELKRLMRIRRPRQPSTWFELHLVHAIEAAGPAGPPTSVPRLWSIIDQGIRETSVQPD